MIDIIIIGGGAAGMTAALYAKRSGKDVLIIERESFGGQIATSPKVENFPSIKQISGLELSNNMFEQICDMGVNFECEDVLKIEKENDSFLVTTNYNKYISKAVIIANGVKHRKLNAIGEDRLLGKGVSYCATCDGAFYKGKDVAVIGYQDHAVEDALYLSPLVNRLYFVFPKPLQASEEHERQLKACANVEWVNGKLLSVEGDPRVDRIEVQTEFGLQTISVSGVFPLSDEQSASIFLAPLAPMTEKGFLKVNEARMTSVPGLFAAGDVVDKKLRQIVNAAGEGAEAATSAMAYARAWRK